MKQKKSDPKTIESMLWSTTILSGMIAIYSLMVMSAQNCNTKYHKRCLDSIAAEKEAETQHRNGTISDYEYNNALYKMGADCYR